MKKSMIFTALMASLCFGIIGQGEATAQQIASIGISSGDHVYAWHKNGTASVGTTRDLDAYHSPYAYSLPSGQPVNDIVGHF